MLSSQANKVRGRGRRGSWEGCSRQGEQHEQRPRVRERARASLEPQVTAHGTARRAARNPGGLAVSAPLFTHVYCVLEPQPHRIPQYRSLSHHMCGSKNQKSALLAPRGKGTPWPMYRMCPWDQETQPSFGVMGPDSPGHSLSAAGSFPFAHLHRTCQADGSWIPSPKENHFQVPSPFPEELTLLSWIKASLLAQRAMASGQVSVPSCLSS